MKISAIVTDIEGTTSAISFVKEVLFPFARTRLQPFLTEHTADPQVGAALAQVADTLKEEGVAAPSRKELLDALYRWTNEDRKHTGLKTLQGLIWAGGYADGSLKSHLYPDVAAKLSDWQALGLRLAVYSSGSTQAQQLFFAHTPAGDLTPLFEAYFDTTIGPKREEASYRAIAARLDLPPEAILFLSDVPEELDAAKAAGWRTVQLVRPGVVAGDRHATAANFDDIL